MTAEAQHQAGMAQIYLLTTKCATSTANESKWCQTWSPRLLETGLVGAGGWTWGQTLENI